MKKLMFLMFSLSALICCCLFISCSDNKTTTSAGATFSRSFPQGFAVASAFNGVTGAGDARALKKAAGVKAVGTRATVTEEQSYEEKTEVIDTIVAAASDAACEITLPAISAAEDGPSCYGPRLQFKNHVDATASHDANDSTGDSTDEGELPVLDLGIWTATDTTSGSACAVAKLNSLVNFAANKTDAALLITASMNCVLTRAGTPLPSAGETVTLTTDLHSAVQVNSSDYTVSSATLAREASDISGNPVYTYSIVYHETATPTKEVTINLKHMSSSATGATYTGKMWTKLQNHLGGGMSYAFSILYEKTATQLKYKMMGTNYDSSNGGASSLFDAAGDLVVSATTQPAIPGNITQFIANITTATGTGDYSYSWQAGTGDSNTRVFNAHTEVSASDATLMEGCSFFAYGDPFVFNTGTIPDNSLSTFICNWAGPDNNHTGQVGLAQKQCVTQNTTGVFDSVAAKEKITYSPNNSCSFNGSTTNPSGGDYNYGLTMAALTGAHAAVTHNLVTVASDTDYADYTAPTAPTDVF